MGEATERAESEVPGLRDCDGEEKMCSKSAFLNLTLLAPGVFAGEPLVPVDTGFLSTEGEAVVFVGDDCVTPLRRV